MVWRKTLCMIMVLSLILAMMLPIVNVNADDKSIVIFDSIFLDSSNNEIYNSIDGSIHAQVNLSAPSGTNVCMFIASYINNILYDVDIKNTEIADESWINTGLIDSTQDSVLKLFVWSGELAPVSKIIYPAEQAETPVLSFGFSDTYCDYLGEIDPENNEIIVDIPVICTNMPTAAGVYSQTDLMSLTPFITTADGWSVSDSDSGAKDFTKPQTYTFTKGDESITYTVKVEQSDLSRTSNFESVSQITTTNQSSHFMESSGARQFMPWAGHRGNGAWYQVGYRADESGVIDETQTFGSFELLTGTGVNTTKIFKLNKAKTDGDFYMYNVTNTSTASAGKYRMSLDICFEDISDSAYIKSIDSGYIYFIKSGSTYDLYYKKKDGNTVFLKKAAVENNKWHNVCISAVNKYINDILYQELEIYIDCMLAARALDSIERISSFADSNIVVGISADSTGIVEFDNWRSTCIDWLDYNNTSTIWVVGDSLACQYSEDSITQGWSSYLQEFIDVSRACVYSIAKSGSISADYLSDDGKYNSMWTDAKSKMKPGDVLLIATGYNEPSYTTMEEYGNCLKEFSEVAHSLNVEPIFITTTVQLNYQGTALENRRSQVVDKMKEVCTETGDVCLDLNTRLINYFTEIGDIEEIKTYYEGADDPETGTTNDKITGDWLHFREKGARICAQFISELAKESDSLYFKELQKGEYIGNLTEFTIGDYTADILGNTLYVSMPGPIGGNMLDSCEPDLSNLDFSYKSDDGTLSRLSGTEYLFTGNNGKTKTYTLVTEAYTRLIEMDFQNAEYDTNGNLLNYPATNDGGAANGGTPATWLQSGTLGTVEVKNGVLNVNKTGTGSSLKYYIKNIEYPAETDVIKASFDLNVKSIGTTDIFMRIDIGENLPCLAFKCTNAENGTFVLNYFKDILATSGAVEISDAPALNTNQNYSFDIVYKKVNDAITMSISIDGVQVAVITGEAHNVYTQAALMPQFQIVGQNSKIFEADFDNINVSYNSDSIKKTQNVYLVGDSICYTYPILRKNSKDIQGWGKTIAERIDSEYYRVINTAREGQSTGIFLNGGLQGNSYDHRYDLAQSWSFIDRTIKAGDYVIIGLAWNDAGYTDIEGYKQNLTTMINNTKAKGATPVIVTVTSGLNMSTGAVTNSKLPYATAAKEVAAASDVVCLDLHTALYELMNSKTVDERLLCYCDGTHYTYYGAQIVGNLICDLLDESELPLKDYILQPAKELTDTNPYLVTFEDFESGSNIDTINTDTRITATSGSGSVTIEDDPANGGTRGKVLKLSTVSGNSDDKVYFSMSSGSGKSKITTQFDIYIGEDSTNAYSGYNYMFYYALDNAYCLPFGFNTNNTSVTGASWMVRANTSTVTVPADIIYPNSAYLEENYPSDTTLANGMEMGTWYTCKMIYDTSDGSADFYIDGNLIYEDCEYYWNSDSGQTFKTSVSKIGFASLKNSTSTIYIDNVSMSVE